MEQYNYAWFLWMTRGIGFILGAVGKLLYARSSLNPQDTEVFGNIIMI